MATPTLAPTDDWVDGSWTVDCSCGVTFDDGEEMVSCDECNVWVHTRCTHYVRGMHISFLCHNCKAKRAPSADEAEVAELLAELPTHCPRPSYRRWAEVPLPARVHVHGIPGGTDSALFHGTMPSPAFSAALWRCTGYVPKRFSFRYYEFPYWADDKDGANALFALAREKRMEKADTRLPLSVGTVQKDKNHVLTLSGFGDKADEGHYTGDDGSTKKAYSLSAAKKTGAPISTSEVDTWDNGCEQKRNLDVPDIEDQHTETNMVNSDLHVLVEARMVDSSSERSGDKKCSASKEISGMLKKYEPKESMRQAIFSGGEMASAVAEQEVHSRFVKVEVDMYEGHNEGNQNVGLQSGLRSNAVVKMDDVKSSNGDILIDAGPEKMHEGLGLQNQPNQTSSNLQVGGVLDLQTNQSESLNIRIEAATQDHERAKAIKLENEEHKSGRQGRGDVTSFSILQRHLSKSTSDLVFQHPKSEIQNQMHTISDNPNSCLGNVKVCTPSSGPTSTPFELSCSLPSTELSSEGTTVRLIKKDQTRLVLSADSENEFAKISDESSQELTRSSEKVQSKGLLTSAPKSSQASRTYVSSTKHRLIVPKEQSQKTATEGSTLPRSLQGEVTPLHYRNKTTPLSFYQRKDKIHHRFIHITQETSNSSASTELQDTQTASLSDEQLALLLHQQLNSSPRVPRVPRGHQAATTQVLHSSGANVLSKRSSAHVGRDQTPVLKKRNKDDPWRDNDDNKRTGKVSFIERRQKDCSTEHVLSVKDSCKSTVNIESEQQNHGICTTGTTTGLGKDTLADKRVPRGLPGLIDEIIGKNINITYGELCDAIHQCWGDLSKPNMEDNAYPSYLHAVNDYLRSKNDWAHLLDQAPPMNPPNKRGKLEESDSLSANKLVTEKMRIGAKRCPGEASAESHQENMPRGKRKARKCRRLELKGRRVNDTRKRSGFDSSSDDDAVTHLV